LLLLRGRDEETEREGERGGEGDQAKHRSNSWTGDPSSRDAGSASRVRGRSGSRRRPGHRLGGHPRNGLAYRAPRTDSNPRRAIPALERPEALHGTDPASAPPEVRVRLLPQDGSPPEARARA